MSGEEEDELELENEVFVNYNFDFNVVRIVENTLVPSRFHIRAEVIEMPDKEEFQLDFAFTKIKFFFEQIINNKAIVFSRENQWAYDRLFDAAGSNISNNTLVITPQDPSDDHLGALIQSKMNALANGTIMFGLIEVKSDNLDGLSFTFAGHGESALPDMTAWVGERTFFSRPWWARNDASTLDVVPPEDADITKPPDFAYNLEFLAEMIRPTDTGGAMVVRPEFRPTIIDGGKL